MFDSPSQLKRYGIGFRGIGTDDVKIHFPTQCYYYGDGSWDISISDELLSTYKSQGFSRRSACMALVSGIRFNPENGKRLATYILIDRKLIKDGKATDAGALSDELPLSLPGCFKGGRPYSDCDWNFDPISGEKMSAQQTAKFRTIGQRIDESLGDPKTKRAFHYIKANSEFTKGKIMVGASVNAGGGDDSAASSTTIEQFPRIWLRALRRRKRRPFRSPEVVKAALTSKKPPAQIDANQLKAIWTSGIQ